MIAFFIGVAIGIILIKIIRLLKKKHVIKIMVFDGPGPTYARAYITADMLAPEVEKLLDDMDALIRVFKNLDEQEQANMIDYTFDKKLKVKMLLKVSNHYMEISKIEPNVSKQKDYRDKSADCLQDALSIIEN